MTHRAEPTVLVIVRDSWTEIVRAPVVRNAGGYAGRHRLLYGCDPEGWPDGLVFWSQSAKQWMRVDGYADEPLDLAPPARTQHHHE